MNWIKENKFLSGFFAVMLVGIGVLGYFLYSASSAYGDADSSYGEKANELNRLRHLPLYPNAKNLSALEAQKADAATAISAFQAQLAARQFPIDEISPAEFQDRLKAAVTEIKKKAEAANVELPKEKFYLGFEPYETRPPEKEAVGPLTRQLKAIQWVMEQLIASKITSLGSLNRTAVAEEKALAGGTGGRKPPEAPATGLVSKHPFDLAFRTKQSALANALNAIVGPSAPQFFIPRVVRIKNDNPKGPSRAAPPTGDAAAGQPAAPSDFLVGNEQVTASIRLEIIEFATPKPKAPK